MPEFLKFFQGNIVAIVVVFGFIGLSVMFYSQRDEKTRNCLDLVTAPNGKYSRTAIGQCFGILVAVWAPIYQTMNGTLDAAIFGLSLAYLAGSEGYATYLRFKATQQSSETPKP